MDFFSPKKISLLNNASKFVGSFSASIVASAVQANGKILLGGSFVSYSPTLKNRLIRLNSDGSLDTDFCINASEGNKFANTVNAIAVQTDGKILVGGAFTNYAGTGNRNALVRLNANGTLDTAFCVNAPDGAKFSTSIVNSIVVQTDGKILVGGTFNSYAGTTNRSKLIRLNSDGTLDTAFCVNASDGTKFSSTVSVISLQTDGKIIIAGLFTAYAGTTGRNVLIRLNSDGTTDTAFCVNASDGTKFVGSVVSANIQADGKILIGGNFTDYAGTIGRDRLIRINSNGTLDTAFCTNASDGSKVSGGVLAFAVQTDGKILFGGSFTNYAGTANRSFLIRLNSDGTLDTAFCNNAVDSSKVNSTVSTLAIQSNSKPLIGGNFINYGIPARNRLVSLNVDGTTDTAFCANASNGSKITAISTSAIQTDGKVLLGGFFANHAGVSGRDRLIRFNVNGTLDTAFCTNATDGSKFSNQASSIVIQTDGKILIGGNFLNYAGTAGRSYLIRLNSDGTLDTAFCVNAVDGSKFNAIIYSIEVQTSGQILVGGSFTAYAGTTGRSYLIRLNSDGTLDTTFCTNATDGTKFNSNPYNTATQTDGKILVGGAFTAYAATTGRSYLIRLNANGTLDTTFCTNATDVNKFNGLIQSTTVQTDGKIVIGGSFTDYATTVGRSYLIRLNSNGTTDTTFCTNATDGTKVSAGLNSVIAQTDGSILVGGSFIAYAGTAGRSYLIRLNSDGTTDTAFCANAVDGTKVNNVVSSIVVQSNSKILICGAFTAYKFSRLLFDRFIRLSPKGLLS